MMITVYKNSKLSFPRTKVIENMNHKIKLTRDTELKYSMIFHMALWNTAPWLVLRSRGCHIILMYKQCVRGDTPS